MKANIPDDWNGEDWTSICVQWPNSADWMSILSGLIASPSNGRNWTRSSGNIKDVQVIGNEIWARFIASEGCEGFMDVRQNPDNPCELDKDMGAGWVQFADLSLCGASMFEDPPYNGPDFELSSDDCLDATIIAWEFYTILLELNTQRASASSANDMFFRTLNVLATKVSFPNVNQILALSNALYAGSNAGFAESFITAFREDMTCELLDQLPAITETNLFVIFQEARDILAAFIAGYEFDGSIPGLAEQVALYLIQAMHTADFMSMYYSSEIETGDCTGCETEWCYVFDFTTSDGGWSPNPPGLSGAGLWVNGQGWSAPYSGQGQDGVYLGLEFPQAGNINYVKITLSTTLTGTNPEAQVANLVQSDIWQVITDDRTIYEFNINEVGETDMMFYIDPYSGGGQAWGGYVVSIELRGSGDNPFGSDNCS